MRCRLPMPPPMIGRSSPKSATTSRAIWRPCSSLSAIVAFSLRIWRADLSVPLKYRGDNLVTQMFIQGIRENGWYLHNPRLGMPLPQQMHDYPMADTLHFVILKLLNWVFHDDGLALNLYSLLCFPLVALSSYFVLRRFRLARLTALAPSVLYACGPYHFCRLFDPPVPIGILLVAAYDAPLGADLPGPIALRGHGCTR